MLRKTNRRPSVSRRVRTSPERLVATTALFLALACTSGTAQEARGVAASKTSPFARVVTIGASVTDGFRNGMPIARLIDSAIIAEHKRVERLASSHFFVNAARVGTKQISRALRLDATFVVGVDFLFWYAYGYRHQMAAVLQTTGFSREEDAALRRAAGANSNHLIRIFSFERGLRELERLACPILIGDIPDMTDVNAYMLRESAFPAKSTLSALNRRLRSWARTRKNIRILPVAKKVHAMKTGKFAIPKLGDKPAIPLSIEQLMAKDRLHTSRVGAIVFASDYIRAMREWMPAHREELRYDVRERLRLKGYGELLSVPKGLGR